ncbi:alpha/beta hydrolase [Corynebacterium camporealensis]|uniref:alpha/beta hydrolase n=1 Tax=Corynebacterium camporealensis TaxID=161896 RepID=UPI0034CDD31A
MTNKSFHTQHDEFSGRPITEDAWPVVKEFRDGGSVRFESLEVPVLREVYVASAQATALEETAPVDTTDLHVDEFGVRIYEPRPQEARTAETHAILFIHGGGWVMGDLATHDSPARRLALATGFPVVAVDYRLAPEHPYPAAVEDCRTALRWLSDSSAEHNLHVTGVSVVGDSAGGQLSAILANEFTGDDSVLPLHAQALIYPATDLTQERLDTGASYQRMQEGFPLVKSTMDYFITSYLANDEDRTASDISPLFAELPENLPPAYVLTVDNDPLADEGIEYAAKLSHAGVDVRHRHLRGNHHGIINSPGAVKAAEEELNHIARFILEYANE